MDDSYKLQEQTRTFLPQVTADVSLSGSECIYGDLMAELRRRFPYVQFSKAQGSSGQAAIYVYDMDFYFSEPFRRFLDELVVRLSEDLIASLDFFPADAPARLTSEPQAPIAAKGIAEAAAKMNFAQPTTTSTPSLPTGYAEYSLNDLGRAA